MLKKHGGPQGSSDKNPPSPIVIRVTRVCSAVGVISGVGVPSAVGAVEDVQADRMMQTRTSRILE